LKVELSAIDEVLNAVDAAAEDFEQSYGKPNQPLIDAKIEAERLRVELHASQNVTEPAELRQRLKLVGDMLVALREHLEKDQRDNDWEGLCLCSAPKWLYALPMSCMLQLQLSRRE
jgi:hypothetical protein